MPHYEKPKILLIDLPATITDRLVSLGFNAVSGSYGTPYKTKTDASFEPMGFSDNLPNLTEQDILFVNLALPELAEEATATTIAVPGEMEWFVKHNNGWIDPRPRAMRVHQDEVDRILEFGGVAVAFAAPRIGQQIVFAKCGYTGIDPQRTLDHDNWSFSSWLSQDRVFIEADSGTEIVADATTLLGSLISRHRTKARYLATIQARFTGDESIVSLGQNKFGGSVACLVAPRKQKGGIVVLPQFDDKEAVIVELVRDILPEISPRLFPDHEGMKWVHRGEYEHPSVSERRARQRVIREKAKAEIEKLDTEVAAEADQWSFLHDLLRESGDNLVSSVKMAFEQIGFRQVTNVDEENPDQANKQEDLQIHDQPPVLLAEVKGIGGLPTESDTLQISKYVLRRSREWNRLDVRGISIINAQRNLPPLERDHDRVFTQAQVDDAKNHETGLITTWDIFRLIRGMMKWGWPATSVQGVFYKTGRIAPIPANYTPVGVVGHFYSDKQVISIDVGEGCTIRVGDRLGFAFEDEFYEEEVESLGIDRKQAQEAGPNTKVGHRSKLKRADVPIGTVVYKVVHPNS